MTKAAEASISARQADDSDADELARLRWLWRAVERGEEGDPSRFRDDFADWMAIHRDTHLLSWSSWTGPPWEWPGSSSSNGSPGLKTGRGSRESSKASVSAEHRNCGLGSILLQELIQGARTRVLDYLSVHPSPPSFPFYRRLRFQGEGSLLFLDLTSA